MVHYNGHALDDNSAHLEGAIFLYRCTLFQGTTSTISAEVFYCYIIPTSQTVLLVGGNTARRPFARSICDDIPPPCKTARPG